MIKGIQITRQQMTIFKLILVIRQRKNEARCLCAKVRIPRRPSSSRSELGKSNTVNYR